ncbi:MAG: hypothetical protein ABJF11_02485 [Reichenbachiella sp.]|uniref:hypothetical protein n=1 Tax=Reichenbachiella sp. TaxID=2184521 RepID=UPI0032659745
MKSLFTFFLSILMMSCMDNTPMNIETEKAASAEFLIFGHFYGFCSGEECIEIFKLTNDALYEDTNDVYPNTNSDHDFSFVQLDESVFKRVENINFEIPSKLLNEAEIIIGAPDAADGGGIYLELPNGRYWLLDMSLTYLPECLHPLREQIRHAINEINR